MAVTVQGTAGTAVRVAFSPRPQNSAVIVIGQGDTARQFQKTSTPSTVGTIPATGSENIEFRLFFFRRPWEYVLDVVGGDAPISQPDSSDGRGLPHGTLFEPDTVDITLVLRS
jgi:hypothetical protein